MKSCANWSHSLGGFFDRPRKETELEKFEKQISEPDFWNDQEQAQKIVQQRSRIEKALEKQKNFETVISDAEILLEFAETDPKSLTELTELLAKLDAEVTEAETESLLSGRNRREQRDLLDTGGRGRHGRAGFRADASANVSALGGTERV